MKFRTRAWTLFLVLSLLSAMLAACSSGSQTKETNKPSDEGKEPEAQTEDYGGHTAPFANGKFDPAIPMTFVPCTTDDIQYYNGESAENNILFQKTKENLGIEIKTLWSAPNKNDACKTKILLSLTSKQNLPDVFYSTDMDLINKLIDSGQFMDLTDAFETYASQGIKDIVANNPEITYPIMRDGKMMALPSANFGPNNPPIMYIRQDWLDNLKLTAPTNMDEFEQLLEAFTNQDPDQNGSKDTIGLAIAMKKFDEAMSDSTAIFGAFGAIPSLWMDAGDGKTLEYGSTKPAIKDALAKLRTWMEKGYLSKDAAQMDGASAQQLFTSGKAGIIFGPNWYPYWPFPDMISVNPDAQYKPYPIPVGPEGKAMRRTGSTVGGALLIHKDYKHPDAVFEYAEKMREFGSDQPIWGLTAENLIQQGYAHEGVPVQPVVYGPLPSYYLDPWAQINTYLDIMVAGKTPETSGQQDTIDNCKRNPLCPEGQVPAMQVWSQQRDIDVSNQYMGPPTDTMTTKKDYLDKLEYETFTKIIYGSLGLDEFDRFVEKWKSGGGDQITAEVNQWYSGNIQK